MRSVDRGRLGGALFAGPQQLELRFPSKEELRKRAERELRRASQRKLQLEKRQKRLALQAQAYELNARGQSLRQIGRAIGVSHQTVANWLAARERYPEEHQEAR